LINDKTISSSDIFTYGNRNDDGNHSLTILHQNIHGLKGKIDEFVLSIVSDMPHLICLSEHHLKCKEMEVAHIPNYKLGAKYCKSSLKCGGVWIYIRKNMKCTNISLLKYYKEQDLEIVAVKLKLAFKSVIVLCAYRAPGGNLEYFLNRLDTILNSLVKPKKEYILCGDLNINYIGTNNKKTQLETLLNMYNVMGTVSFPTRITNASSSGIDNIFVDKRSNYTIKPYVNGLSDHDAQLLILNNLVQSVRTNKPIYIRNINKLTTVEFLSLLSEEQWEDVFDATDVNIMFKIFLNTYLRCYNTSFLKVNISKSNLMRSGWITKGIEVSYKRKKELFVLCEITNHYKLKLYYRKYCLILTKVIRSAKRMYYNNIILQPKNKMKSTWKIINNESR
jgi:exonuclease III